MIKWKERTETVQYAIESITCDVCGIKYIDEMEMQEFHYVSFIGGFMSVFGDEAHIRCDICQYCLKKLIGEYIQREI